MAEKRTRRTRAELRDMMIAGGRDILFDLEPSLGFESLTYSTVFAHLQEKHGQKVTIGSVHERLWKSQRDFQLDVVANVLSDTVSSTAGVTFASAADQMRSHDLSTPAGRRYALQSAVRLSSRRLFEYPEPNEVRLTHMVRFRLWEMGPDHDEAAGFAETIHDIRAASNEAYSKVIRALMEIIGLRVRADAGDPDQVIADVALLNNATLIGLETDALSQARSPRTLPTGPDGEDEEWFPDCIALWTYARSMFELDGDDLTDDERRL